MSYVIMEVVKGKVIFQCESEGRKKKKKKKMMSQAEASQMGGIPS